MFGVEREGGLMVGEPTEEGEGGVVDGRGEWGVPGADGWWVIEVDVVVNVGGVVMGGGGLSTCTEEAALGLAIMEFGGKVVGGGGVAGGGAGEKVGDEGGAANGEAEETDTGGEFRLRGALTAEVSDGRVKVGGVRGGEERGG